MTITNASASVAATPKNKGSASYFPSIEITYGESMSDGMTVLKQAGPSQTHGAGQTAQGKTQIGTRVCEGIGCAFSRSKVSAAV